MAQPNTRPFGITLLMIYGYIVGLANIALGIFVILDRYNPQLVAQTLHTPNQLLSAGIVAIVFGTVQILLASALGHANNLVRIIYSVVAALNLAAGLWAAFGLYSEQRVAGIVSALFSGLVLYFLFNQAAEKYFEQSKK